MPPLARAALAATALAAAAASACSKPLSNPVDAPAASGDAALDDDGGPPRLVLPPANAGLDYQLGGAYPPPAGVAIVARDRNAPPAAGLYNLCYVNGFQIQPDEEQLWLTEHPDLILRDDAGAPVIDPDC
jgi:hypothetical protein